MKRILATLIIVAATLAAQTASADSRNGRGWDRHNNHGYYSPGRYRSNNYYRGNYRGNYRSSWYGGYSYPYNYGSNYLSISVGSRHHRHDNFSTGSFIGGLLVGSVLTAPRHYETYTYRQPVVRQPSVTVINRTPVVRQPVTTGRRLLRDLEGRCYELGVDSAGNETRLELDPSACNF